MAVTAPRAGDLRAFNGGDWLWVSLRPSKPSVSDFSETCIALFSHEDGSFDMEASGLREGFPSDAEDTRLLWRHA